MHKYELIGFNSSPASLTIGFSELGVLPEQVLGHLQAAKAVSEFAILKGNGSRFQNSF